MSYAPNTLSLVADIGGTNTRCALADGAQVLTQSVRRYANADYPDLQSVLRRYIDDESDVNPRATCIAVAGPVHDGVGQMTNLDWTIDRQVLAEATQAEHVAILNDLQAQGHAIGAIAPSSIRSIIKGSGGPESQNAAKMVVGIGTGFNAAAVFDTEQGRFVPPSECGHANLPLRSDQELRLAQYVSSAHGFAAIEDVLSGRGLERIYAFLGEEENDPRNALAKDIMSACAAGTDPRAEAAARLFAQILGTVCGNLSLIQLPLGGVFLVGGVARALAPYLEQFGFAESYQSKGRFTAFMGQFSLSVIEDDYAALVGCARHIETLSTRQIP